VWIHEITPEFQKNKIKQYIRKNNPDQPDARHWSFHEIPINFFEERNTKSELARQAELVSRCGGYPQAVG